MAAKWPAELVEMLWADNPDQLISASGHTPLQGKRVADGVEISGTQRFVSGCNFAQWIMSPVMMDGEMHNAVVAIEDCQVMDNWNTLGMRGSGSNAWYSNAYHPAAHTYHASSKYTYTQCVSSGSAYVPYVLQCVVLQ